MALELWGLFASSFIASTLFPGGSEVLLLWLVQQHEISQWVLLSVAIVGNTLGGWVTYFLGRFVALNLNSALEREKGVPVNGVHRKSEKSVVTLLMMRIFSGFLGASRTSAYFRDSIAEFRFKYPAKIFSTDKQIKAQSWLKKYGSTALLLSWVPLIGDPLCLLAGWLRLNTMLCLVFIFIGKAVRYWLIVQLATL